MGFRELKAGNLDAVLSALSSHFSTQNKRSRENCQDLAPLQSSWANVASDIRRGLGVARAYGAGDGPEVGANVSNRDTKTDLSLRSIVTSELAATRVRGSRSR
jgi:hypothetical protein